MMEKEINEKIQFQAGEFVGPLDLLLFLIKKSEINIYDIPIAQITEQYLDYLQYAIKVNLDNIVDFYDIAATLLYVKSKMLLPVEINLEDEIEDPRKELVEMLLEYQKYKKLSEYVEEKGRENEDFVSKREGQRMLPFSEEGSWEHLSVWDLVKTFSSIIYSLSSERVLDLYEEVTVNEKITLINEFLENRKEFIFFDLIKSSNSKLEIICSFIAILEMVKRRQICVYQNKLFGDVRIKKMESNIL